MNKSDLIEAIAMQTGLTRADASKALNATTNIITSAMSKGESVALIGFGTF